MKPVFNILALILLLLLLPAFAFWQTAEVDFPVHFPKPKYDFSANPLTDSKIALGRRLFYEPALSRDGKISCASCHSPYNAFAHTDHDLSHGIDDQIGNRNAPALMNLAWHDRFMWDGAIHHLDVQALAPLTHPKEMGESIANVVRKLQQKPPYPLLFAQAFGDTLVTGERLLKALSQFQLSLISANAKYDSVQLGLAYFTEKQQNGYHLFLKNCNSCHQEPLFSTFAFANNGLPIDSTLNDYGRGQISKLAADSFCFKIPTLRNLAYTYPYMHDGRFKKLNQVLQHYTQNIQHTPNLAAQLQTPISLTSNQKADLLAFLQTLNDKSFVFNPRYAGVK